jgi:hypothetical protein
VGKCLKDEIELLKDKLEFPRKRQMICVTTKQWRISCACRKCGWSIKYKGNGEMVKDNRTV